MNANVGIPVAPSRRVKRISQAVSGLAVGLGLCTAAHAQIDYDPDRYIYFVTGDATIATDIGSNDVVVGVTSDGQGVPFIHTLTVASGAIITGFDDGPDGGNYGLNVFGNGHLSVEGGNVDRITGYGIGNLNIRGGTVNQIENEGLGKVNISGGTVSKVFSGATVSNVLGVSDINISGGSVGQVNGELNSINISGGVVTGMTVPHLGSLRLSGGAIGGIDNDVFDMNIIGVYYYNGGSLNLFGSDFARTNPLAGRYAGRYGEYSTLTGTLLDGRPLNTTLFVADGLNVRDKNCGGNQFQPLLGVPQSGGGGGAAFGAVPSGAWFDPPLVGAYDFAMTDDNFFTSILDFPVGIGDADELFTVSVGDVVLGQFAAGMDVNFADYGFADGVSAFTVSGIDPTVDAENPTAFPIRLAFSSDFASFTMTGVTGTGINAPEPGSLALLGVGLTLAGVFVRCRKSRR